MEPKQGNLSLYLSAKAMKKGLTLIEFIITFVIMGIGLVAITSLLYSGWKDWQESREIKELQEDLDIASFNIKGLVEESNYYEIQDIIEDVNPEKGRKLYIKFTEDDEPLWEKMFYAENNKLILEDIKKNNKEIIINTLQDLIFSELENETPEIKNTIKVEITVGKNGRNFKNEFLVRVRNK